ncbi:type II toxin-antitoxin system HicA family toxin [Bartonella phoceensis]|uniref:type II toxin-antitoxin system HicA family toxin n=1 Tax=Bartonella phoceensis TaxID=270249 RepID=UPI001ABA19C8|nr:type II toxin-antitoxin system HicA family toxin [Bartonella phoceensis]
MEKDSRKIIAKLKGNGFGFVKMKGFHHKFMKDGKVIIIPHSKKNFPIGATRSITLQAG